MHSSSTGSFWQQGAAAGRFRNILAWSALQASSSCRKCLASLHWCSHLQTASVIIFIQQDKERVDSAVYLAQGWFWMQTKASSRSCEKVFLFPWMERFPFFVCYLWKPSLWSCDCQGKLFLFSMPFLQNKKRSLTSIEVEERKWAKKEKETLKYYITYKIIY